MWKTIVLALALGVFLWMTLVVLNEHSYLGFLLSAGANSATRLMSLDIILSLGLITIWMIIDARQRHASFLPFVAVTTLFGAAGPLAYLVMREQTRRIQRVVAFALLIALCAVALATLSAADLRPRALRQPSAQASEGGRQLHISVVR